MLMMSKSAAPYYNYDTEYYNVFRVILYDGAIFFSLGFFLSVSVILAVLQRIFH